MRLAHRPALHVLALALMLPCANAGAAQPALPSLQQAQAAMHAAFDAELAKRPASDSSRIVAEAFRPQLQALSSCAPAEAAPAGGVDCIAMASAGPNARPQLLRFVVKSGQWQVSPRQDLPVPAPSQERVQALLRARIAAQAGSQTDPALRARYQDAARTLEVTQVRNCQLGEERAVIECTVHAGDGRERGEQPMAFVREDGQWQDASTD